MRRDLVSLDKLDVFGPDSNGFFTFQFASNPDSYWTRFGFATTNGGSYLIKNIKINGQSVPVKFPLHPSSCAFNTDLSIYNFVEDYCGN